MQNCATNGRFCPHDLWHTNLPNHWVSDNASNNSFLAHWFRLGDPSCHCERTNEVASFTATYIRRIASTTSAGSSCWII